MRCALVEKLNVLDADRLRTWLDQRDKIITDPEDLSAADASPVKRPREPKCRFMFVVAQLLGCLAPPRLTFAMQIHPG